MMKQHLYLFVGAAVVGYLMANTLVAYQPWKVTASLANSL